MIKFLLLFALSFISLISQILFAQSNDLTKSKRLIEEGIFLEAIYYLNKHLAKNPDDLAALKLRAKSYLTIKMPDSALKDIKVLKRNVPSCPEVDSLIKILQKDYDITFSHEIKEIKKIVPPKKKKDKLETVKILTAAKKAKDENNFLRACSLYSLYLEKKPDDYQTWFELCQVASWALLYDKAIDAYNNYLSKYPEDKKAQFELGLVYSWDGQYEKALTLFDKLEKETLDPKVLFAKAQVLTWQNKMKEALNCYERLKEISPQDQRIAREYQKIKKQIEAPKITATSKKEVYELSLGFHQKVTSDGFRLTSLGAKFHFGLDLEAKSAFGYNRLDYQERDTTRIVNQFSLEIEKEFTNNFNIVLDFDYLAILKSDDLMRYGLWLNYSEPLFKLSAGFRHFPIVDEVLRISPLIKMIESDNLIFMGNIKPFKQFELGGRYRFGLYSDKNQTIGWNFEIAFFPFDIFKIGYGYRSLSYKSGIPEYWSPKFYESHRGWFYFGKPIPKSGSSERRGEIFYEIYGEVAKPTGFTHWEKSFNAALLFSFHFNLFLKVGFGYGETGRAPLAYPYAMEEMNFSIFYRL